MAKQANDAIASERTIFSKQNHDYNNFYKDRKNIFKNEQRSKEAAAKKDLIQVE